MAYILLASINIIEKVMPIYTYSSFILSGAHNERGKEREAPTHLIKNSELTHAAHGSFRSLHKSRKIAMILSWEDFT